MTTTEYVWTVMRADAVERFSGELPIAATEQAIIAAFKRDPLPVERAISDVAEQHARGAGPRSCWAAVRHRLIRIDAPDEAIVRRHAKPTTPAPLEQRERTARRWIETCGWECAVGSVVDELFARNGVLHPEAPWDYDRATQGDVRTHDVKIALGFADDADLDLVERTLAYWRELHDAAATA